MSELERIEAQAIRDAVVLGGGRAEMIGGAMCVSHPDVPIPELNRAIPVGDHVDVGAVAAWFRDTPHSVAAAPWCEGLEEQLAAHGYQPRRAWMKFTRGPSPAPPVETGLRIAETTDPAVFALTSGEGTGMSPAMAAAMSGIVGAPGWRVFIAWAGDDPAACGALYADGDTAWVGAGATRPTFRQRGAQSALLAARIEAARSLGARTITTETGAQSDDRPNQSYRNILRAGFAEAYLRPNWGSPA